MQTQEKEEEGQIQFASATWITTFSCTLQFLFYLPPYELTTDKDTLPNQSPGTAPCFHMASLVSQPLRSPYSLLIGQLKQLV